MTNHSDDPVNDIDEDRVADLVQQAEELSRIVLAEGHPAASALITLAVSDLRKKVA